MTDKDKEVFLLLAGWEKNKVMANHTADFTWYKYIQTTGIWLKNPSHKTYWPYHWTLDQAYTYETK